MVRESNFTPVAAFIFIAAMLIFILLTPTIILAQSNEIEVTKTGNDVCVTGTDMNCEWYQFHFQQIGNGSNNINIWSNSPDTCITEIPFCNFKASRTAFPEPSNPIPSNVVQVQSIDFDFKAWVSYPYINLFLYGEWDKVTVTMWDVYGKQTGFLPGGNLEEVYTQEGQYQLFPNLRYGKINHPRWIRFEVESGDCKSVEMYFIYY